MSSSFQISIMPEQCRLIRNETQSLTHNSASPLLALPAELRNKIYDFVFAEQAVTICSHQPTFLQSSSLARACRQTRHETLALFYNRSYFLPCKHWHFPSGTPGLVTIHMNSTDGNCFCDCCRLTRDWWTSVPDEYKETLLQPRAFSLQGDDRILDMRFRIHLRLKGASLEDETGNG